MAVGPVFLATLLASFSFSMLLAGLFGAYFGRGRSRSVGYVLSLGAVLLLGLFVSLTWPVIPGLDPVFDGEAVGQSIIAVLGALLGSILAVAAFVVAVMRS
jgi:hypothetical protein